MKGWNYKQNIKLKYLSPKTLTPKKEEAKLTALANSTFQTFYYFLEEKNVYRISDGRNGNLHGVIVDFFCKLTF